MKKVIAQLLICTLLLVPMNFCIIEATESTYMELYVNSNTGTDSGDGTINSPFKTIERAQIEVRENNTNMTGDIIVNIASGRYALNKAIEFEQADSGKNGYRVIYRGKPEDMPVISGAVQVTGFTEGTNGIWQTQVDLDFVRELSINGVMADRAHSENKIFGTGHFNPTYDESGAVTAADGIYVNKADLGLYQNPSDIELMWGVAHTSSCVHIDNIIQDPDNSEQVIVTFSNPFWSSIFNKNVNIYSAP